MTDALKQKKSLPTRREPLTRQQMHDDQRLPFANFMPRQAVHKRVALQDCAPACRKVAAGATRFLALAQERDGRGVAHSIRKLPSMNVTSRTALRA